MAQRDWNALILAAGRGPDDPMAKAFAVANKCLIPVGGVAMVRRVWEALRASGMVSTIRVSIEDAGLLPWEELRDSAVASAGSAPGSALAAIRSGSVSYPVLITTGDHALLTPGMIRYFCDEAETSGADVCAGLARAETILAAYPQSARTFFTLGADRVSGCNLFAVTSPGGLKLLERWQHVEHARKRPWRLVAAFGIPALARFVLGRLTLDKAFEQISGRLGLVARPILMPFAEAAIDVDKPADKELAERIIAARAAGP